MSDGTTQYGFDWGNVSVTRVCQHKGTRVVSVAIKPGGKALYIQVSPMGRTIRVFKGCIELKEPKRS